jgi:hypothetical protein
MASPARGASFEHPDATPGRPGYDWLKQEVGNAENSPTSKGPSPAAMEQALAWLAAAQTAAAARAQARFDRAAMQHDMDEVAAAAMAAARAAEGSAATDAVKQQVAELQGAAIGLAKQLIEHTSVNPGGALEMHMSLASKCGVPTQALDQQLAETFFSRLSPKRNEANGRRGSQTTASNYTTFTSDMLDLPKLSVDDMLQALCEPLRLRSRPRPTPSSSTSATRPRHPPHSSRLHAWLSPHASLRLRMPLSPQELPLRVGHRLLVHG